MTREKQAQHETRRRTSLRFVHDGAVSFVAGDYAHPDNRTGTFVFTRALRFEHAAVGVKVLLRQARLGYIVCKAVRSDAVAEIPADCGLVSLSAIASGIGPGHRVAASARVGENHFCTASGCCLLTIAFSALFPYRDCGHVKSPIGFWRYSQRDPICHG